MNWVKISDRIKPAWYTYQGSVESCEWEFVVHLPDQLIFDNMGVEIAREHATALLQEGETLLRTEVWFDKSPTWETYYKCRVWSTASPLAWLVVIPLVIAALSFIVSAAVTFLLVRKIQTHYFGSPVPPDEDGFECVDNSDCAPGQICQGGYCIAGPEEPPWEPSWWPVGWPDFTKTVIGVGAGLGVLGSVLLIVRGGKK